MSDSSRLRTSFLLLLLVLFCPLLSHADVGFRRSLADSTSSNSLLRRPVQGISKFQPRAILEAAQPQAVFSVQFDSTFTRVVYTYRVKETDLLQPTVLTYDEYKALRYETDLAKQWRDETIKVYKRTRAAGSGEGIAIDVPFKIKSKTFRRLFGGDNVGVRVQGNITINGSLRRQKSDQLQAANQRNANTSFRIDMVQQFSITGKVGQKVEVKVDQDSERLFDFENSIKLTYTGDEDEIVQKIEAGNVNLNLGTRLATFSGKNTGLFGLKTQLKLGALSLTGIASLERGQKNRLTPAESGQGTDFFNEREFVKDRYFWLTSVGEADDSTGTPRTIPNYRENYRTYVNREHIGMPVSQQIKEINVYVSDEGTLNPDIVLHFGRAVAMQFYSDLWLPNAEFDTLANADGDNRVVGSWRKLESSEFELDAVYGFIRLKQALQTDQKLACAFVTGVAPDTMVYGTMNATADPTRPFKAVLLRSGDPAPSDSTWDLMFRHVYAIGATNLDPNSFKLTITRASSSDTQPETGPPAETPGYCPDGATGCTYLNFFRFDQEGEGATAGADGIVDNKLSLIDFAHGEIEFLDLTPFDPSGYTDNGQFVRWGLAEMDNTLDPEANQFISPQLYNTRASSITGTPLWRMDTEYKGSSSVFSLGPLVLEGSEEVTLNGAPLQRGSDYTIDYASGELRILNEAAKAQGADLQITFESGTVFQLDKKTLLGARAEYELWDQSYIGAMVLHLNEKTLDKRVRIGSEPIRNTLYDVNTSLRFQPNFISRAVDAIPLIKTDQGSELVIDAEMARVYPNPNSLENPRTGDYNGLAYIDDFEGSRRSTPLGLLRRMWTVPSIPEGNQIDHRRGRFRWWNPNTRDQVPVQEVFPDREVNSQVANTLQSLVLEFTPDAGDTSNPRPPERSWGGVMRYLGEGYADQSKSQFLEVWIRLPGSPEGQLIIDLGEVSEDALPNDSMDTEDLPAEGVSANEARREYGNGLLEPVEDTGLDGIGGNDPDDMAYWNGLDQPPIPSWDDWAHQSNSSDFLQANGTEHSRNDEGGNYPDTEDLDDDDFLDQANNYYSYTIDLDFNNPYIAGGNYDNNWRLFRIPIASEDTSARTAVGSPDLASVRWARVWMTGMTRQTTLEIVQMDIVSNEWLPRFSQTDSTEYITAAVINTHENPTEYESPPGVSGEVDPITNLRQREQSLALKINQLGGTAPDEFFLVKDLHLDRQQGMNLLEYKRLKMFVHGGAKDVTLFPDARYQIILRMGQSSSDINNNFYDIVTTVRPGWDAQNAIDVALNDISLMQARRDSALADTINYPDLEAAGRFAWAREDTPWGGDSLVIKGNPSVSRVYYFALGVRRIGKDYNAGEDDEIWVDELRVSDIYKDPGTAADLTASLKMADFITLQGGYSTRDADFHNVNVRTGAQQGGGQATQRTVRGNATISLHKIGVDRYGFNLPLTMAYQDNVSIPKYIPNTGSRVDPKHAPDEIITESQSFSYNLRYSKGGNSKNPFVRWSLEKLSLGWDYSFDKGHDFTTLKSRGENSSASAGYSFPTAKGRGIAPIWWMKNVPVLGILGSPRFYFKPTKLQLTANANKREEYRETRSGQITSTRLFNTTRSLDTGFNFIDPLTTDYRRTHKGILSYGDWADILQYDFGRTNDVQQTFTNNYSPQISSWLRPTFNYGTSYGWQWRNPNALPDSSGFVRIDQGVSNSRNTGVDLQLDFRSIFGGGGGGRGRGSGRGDDRGNGGRGNSPQIPGAPAGDPRLGQPGLDDPRMGMTDPRGMTPDSLGGSKSFDPRVVMGQLPGSAPGLPSDTTRRTGDTTAVAQDTTQVVRPRGPSIGERLSSVISPLKRALLVLDPIVLGFDNTESHQQGGTVGQAAWAYQLGFTQNPGLDTVAGVSSIETKRSDHNLTGRSGIRFTQDIRSTFNYSFRTGESRSGTQAPNGTVEQTMFWIGGKGQPKRYPFVDVSMDWSGLEKFPFLSRVAQSVSLSSALSNKVSEQWTNSRGDVRQREHIRQWNPFLGVNFTWKGNVDTQLRYGRSNRFTDNIVALTYSRTSEQTISGTVSYTIRTGFRIPVLWLSSLKLQNQTTFSLNTDYRATVAEQAQDRVHYVKQSGSQTAWSISPRMTYSFSNTVQGQGSVSMQRIKDTVTNSKSSTFEFGIQVNIAIRG